MRTKTRSSRRSWLRSALPAVPPVGNSAWSAPAGRRWACGPASSRRINSSVLRRSRWPSSSPGTARMTGSISRSNSSPASEICVHTTRRSCRSRCWRISLSALSRASSRVMSGSAVIMRLPMAEQVSPWGCAPRRILQHVVLRRGHAPVARLAVESALQAVGRAQQVEQRLFFQAGKGALLQRFRAFSPAIGRLPSGLVAPFFEGRRQRRPPSIP